MVTDESWDEKRRVQKGQGESAILDKVKGREVGIASKLVLEVGG